MNSYDDNLRDSLAGSLGALADQQAALLHGRSRAELELHHAMGAALAAGDRLELDQRQRDERRLIHHAAKRAHEDSIALRGTLALAKQSGDAATANTVIAARNLQASADAIMRLASTVGAALNVASAALYDTELHHQIARVNDQLNRVANQARFLALKGTEVSGRCAEGVAGALVDHGADVEARLGDLLAQALTALNEKVAAVETGETTLGAARAVEVTARARLREAQARQEAITATLTGARRHGNLDLRVEVLSARRIKVAFTAFTTPFAPDGRHPPPAPDARTFLAVVPRSLADQFTSDRAAQLFGKWDGEPGPFTAVAPGEALVTLTRDAYGAAIADGAAYVAFLYIEPSLDYKRHLGSFRDVLSIASAPFVPLTPLPAPAHVGENGAGESGKAGHLLLAVADQGQAGGAGATLVAELEAGAARLDGLVDWLRLNGARLAPGLAFRLDGVAPPFAAMLKDIVATLKAGRPVSAHGEAKARDLLADLGEARDPADPEAPPPEVTALRGLLEELGGLIGKARAATAHVKDVHVKDVHPVRAKDGHTQDAASPLELRCILVDHAIDGGLAGFARDGALPPYFTLETARAAPPANYTLARRLDGAPKGATTPAALKDAVCLWYEVELDAEGKDCFGNPLLPGHHYTPFVLTTMRGPEPGEWGDTLTILDHVWRLA